MEGAADRLAVRSADITSQLHLNLGELKRGMQHGTFRSSMEPHFPPLVFILHNPSVFHSYCLSD